MCGIAGAFFIRRTGSYERFASRALSALAHRGPDDEGRAQFPEGVLIHRRLSILDPSPAGHQPMSSADGRYWIVHNGEVYNYVELRRELTAKGFRFESGTDTEVILAAFRQWGLDAMPRLNGIWAFAIWDAVAKQLVISRDRLGVKPLYIATVDQGVVFGSEVKAILPLLPTVEPNLSAIRDYLWHGWTDHSESTFFRLVEQVPPGTTVVARSDGISTHRYWRITELSRDARPEPQHGDRALVQEFEQLLRDAIRLQLRSDVPVGTCLSGGLDSSTIVSLASSVASPADTVRDAAPRLGITASFPGFRLDERERAETVARNATIQHIVVQPNPSSVVHELDQALDEQDEPFISSSILAQREVMAAARARGIKVMLDGQGADELLAGYPHYRYAWVLGILKHHPAALPRALASLMRLDLPVQVALRQAVLAEWQLRRSGRAPVGRNAGPHPWLGPAVRHLTGLPLRGWGDVPPGTPLARHLYMSIVATSLPALLRYEDRSSMRYGVEARVPFLDHRLVEFACRLPDRLKIRDGITKIVLRIIGERLLPEPVWRENTKIGFATPHEQWLARDLTAIAAVFERSVSVAEGVLASDGLRELLVAPTRDAGGPLWRCLSVELWLRRFCRSAAV